MELTITAESVCKSPSCCHTLGSNRQSLQDMVSFTFLLDAHQILLNIASNDVVFIGRLELVSGWHGSFHTSMHGNSARRGIISPYVAFSSAFFAFEPRSFASESFFLGRCA